MVIPESSPFFDSAIVRAEHIYDSGKKAEALIYIRNIHAKADNLSIQDEMNFYSYCSTIYMKYYKDYDHSIALADTMLSILEKNGLLKKLPIREIQAYNMKADALLAKGLYNEAYDQYFIAKRLAKETGDTCSMSSYSHSMGMVLYRQQKFVEAASNFKQSFSEAGHCTEGFTYFYLKQELLDDIGICYSKARQFDSAMVYFKADYAYVMSNFKKFPHKREAVYESALAVIDGNMADVYLATGVYDTARALLDRSIKVNLQKGYTNSDAELGQLKLANLYLTTHTSLSH